AESQALPMMLPGGSEWYGATADGKAIAARRTADGMELPLPATNKGIEVAITYLLPAPSIGLATRLLAPLPDFPIAVSPPRVVWRLPAGFEPFVDSAVTND